MERLRGEQAAADSGAKPVLDVGGLAKARGGERVAQASELGDLEADGIDGALGNELEYLAQGAGRLVRLHGDRDRSGDQRKTRELIRRHRLLDQIDAMLAHAVERGDPVFG